MKTILKEFEEIATYYIHALEGYTPEEFRRKPSAEEWSMSQLYNHLITAAFHMQIKGIEDCEQMQHPSQGEKTAAAAAIFAAGVFPPIKVKVPSKPGYTPDYSTDKEEITERLYQVIEEMRSIEERLSTIPEDSKVQHPAFGYLNAVEWFRLVPMHFTHHLRQKEAIDRFLRHTA
ncbi:DinB family protein [Aneurinibacillus sp. REN35]|uniref:DinB family protein n=1 Tax=Aneurinibacillus sp. REN35 TaxID=3237286 RepID=UPI0035297FA4